MQSSELATFAGGCFWCVEAVFKRLKGVLSVESGYCGGALANPSYEQICTGQTGHAEVIQIRFDPTQISFQDLLNVFFTSHDPTTLNRQGHDSGTQYRSAVFYHHEEQRALTQAWIQAHQTDFETSIVTDITPITAYYPAESMHQDYYARNPNQAYCRAVIPPKLAKLAKLWAHLLC